ncbi:tRNA (guanosine(46)-N7)-methyltransferase TrmB [Aristophania vespae]|uniref:tRNA (guanine-N(7)-)-methyltransferase n=1 Tax=Aristophania vespae TaxID=2697033 RepID=A0A6P1NEX4_9PROT|nr:tRNA (guanine(46)-N(7))-methyltransferase TrmB [Aristophania vespae]QHI96008.1 tRNA (guanosine(46)-N7)-methyltransferase TrmB [Aristophania vespae]UMM63770.1 tRNA (guanine-N(7)-)-methyltransferase [Aristophania vespae]
MTAQLFDDLKPQPERLYGRQRGHPLRARQQILLDKTLPRMSFDAFKNPLEGFSRPVSKIFLEIGFGGGEHALDQSERHADVGYIASEVFENGICSLLSRVVSEGEESEGEVPANLRLWTDDARLLMKELPDQSLDRAYLMFPDPWPKSRHAKRRFVHPVNIAHLARLLKKDAEWRIASDHPVYQEWVTEVMSSQPYFELKSFTQERPESWSPTRYEAKAFREGRQPFYWTFVRRA